MNDDFLRYMAECDLEVMEAIELMKAECEPDFFLDEDECPELDDADLEI
jgi:hypothetical protein